MRYFYDKRFDKRAEIVFSILDTFWKQFVKLNKESEKLVWPRRTLVMEESEFNRRNAYKHIHKLMIYNIFEKNEKLLIPTSFVFEINGQVFNASKYLFREELPIELHKEEVYTVTPKINPKQLTQLLENIQVEENSLKDYISVSIELAEHYSYTQDYHYNEFPQTSRIITGWEQGDKEIADEEEKLLKLLMSGGDPFEHNTLLVLNPNDASPFIQLDSVNREYVIAGSCSRAVGGELRGRIDEGKTNSFILFYDKKKKLIGRKEFQDIMSYVLLVGSRALIKGNLLGWYDFRNNKPAERYVNNHYLVSFLKVNVPEKTEYVKIQTSEGSYFELVSVFPFSKFPKKLIEERIKTSERFVQAKESIFYYENVRLKDIRFYKQMNDLLMKASNETGNKKNKLLLEALGSLDRFTKILRKEDKITEELLYIMNSAFDARLLLSLAIRKKSKELNERIRKEILKDYYSMLKLIALLRKKKIFLEKIPVLLMTLLRQYRDIHFYLKQELEIKNLKKTVKENKKLIDKSSDSDLKIEFYKWLLNFEKNIVEQQLMSGEKLDIKDVEDTFNSLAKIYKELAEHIRHFPRHPSQEKIFQNKYLYYKNQSLFYTYANIIFKAEVLSKTDSAVKELVSSLEEFERRLF